MIRCSFCVGISFLFNKTANLKRIYKGKFEIRLHKDWDPIVCYIAVICIMHCGDHNMFRYVTEVNNTAMRLEVTKRVVTF